MAFGHGVCCLINMISSHGWISKSETDVWAKENHYPTFLNPQFESRQYYVGYTILFHKHCHVFCCFISMSFSFAEVVKVNKVQQNLICYIYLVISMVSTISFKYSGGSVLL